LKTATHQPQYLQEQKGGGAPGVVHKWEMTVISHTSMVGLGTCVGGSQVKPMTSASSPAPAGSIPRSWELRLASTPSPAHPTASPTAPPATFTAPVSRAAQTPQAGCTLAPGTVFLGQLLKASSPFPTCSEATPKCNCEQGWGQDKELKGKKPHKPIAYLATAE